MDTAFNKDRYRNFTEVWSGTASCDAGTEVVVPDTMPDIGTILDTEGVLLIRSKQTEAGTITLSATVNASVLYAPEEGGSARCLQMILPVEIRTDAPGADSDCRTVAQVRIRSMDARAANPRKIALRADVGCTAAVYRKQDIEFSSSPVEKDEAIQTLMKTTHLLLTADVREKTFVISDEYAPPAGCSVEGILAQRVALMLEDSKFVSGKLVFRGRARVFLLFAGTEAGQLYPAVYETEFSQIMEADCGGEATADVSLAMTGVYFDLPTGRTSNGKVTTELHLVAQAVCMEETEAPYIADTYSNCAVLKVEEKTQKFPSSCRPITARQTVMGFLELPGEGTEALFYRTTVGNVSDSEDNISAVIGVRVIYRRRDGSLGASSTRLNAEFGPDLPKGSALRSRYLLAPEVFASQASGGLDVRVPVELYAMAVSEDEITFVDSISVEEKASQQGKEIPSLVLVRAEAGTDLWMLAKQYHSTVDAIRAVNDGREEGLLLIPKRK